MQNERKRLYLDKTQKLITKLCWQQCSTDGKYTISTVNDTIKQIGYNKYSKIAIKAYPDDRIDHLYLYTPLFRMNQLSFGIKNNEKI